MADLLVILRNALAHQRQGDLDSAERAYREVLLIDNRNFDAIHLLGVIQTQRGNIDDAVRLLSLAVEVNSRSGDAYFHLAAAMVKKGDFRNALGAYDQAVRMFPNDAEMYFLRGTCCYRLQEYDVAVSDYDHAIALRPNYAEALDSRGAAFYALGRFEDAVASYSQALCINSKLVATYSNRGAALRKLQQWDAALADYDHALKLNEMIAEVHLNRGNLLRSMKRFGEAVESYDRAIQLRPNFAEAFVNRGMVFREINELDAAVESCDTAIALDPSNAEAFFERGNALRDLQRWEEADQAYERATNLFPTYTDAFTNRGAVLCELHRFHEAVDSCQQAIILDPNCAEAYLNRGVAIWRSADDLSASHQDALASFDRALELDSNCPKAYLNRAYVLGRIGKFADAKASLNAAINCGYAEPGLYFARGCLELLLGNLSAGWMDYELRWHASIPNSIRPQLTWPEWKGEELRGKSILIHGEQGFGDQFQFIRYLPLLAQRGAMVTFHTSTLLHRLFRCLPQCSLFNKDTNSDQRFDFHCPLLSLPLHFQTTLETIPAETPYLFAEPELANAWNQRLGSHGFKVGIAWQGSPTSAADVGRSIPLKVYERLASFSGVRLISLQKNHGLEQLQDLPAGMKVETLGADFDEGPDAFIDTAAVMANLDLIVTSDTSIAHLAGALGRPVWVALKYAPDWRWLLDREDSPWYPTMRLFRQTTHGDWAEVIAHIAKELHHTVGLNSNQRH